MFNFPVHVVTPRSDMISKILAKLEFKFLVVDLDPPLGTIRLLLRHNACWFAIALATYTVCLIS